MLVVRRLLVFAPLRGIRCRPAAPSIHCFYGTSSLPPKTIKQEDLFGTLSEQCDLVQEHEQSRESFDSDDHDGEEEFRAKIADTGRPRPVDYLRQMNDLVRKRDLRAALNLLDVDMRREYVQPREKHFRVLIHACGKEGYTKKAFELYREYTARRLDHNHGIHSDLFNSCANSPFPEYALLKAKRLRQKLAEKHMRLPGVVYHTMLKAFGRCGDLETSFSLVDEMRREKLPVNAETYAHLFQGCISDTPAGFRHAVLVWRNMVTRRVQPELPLYHLLLRATKECGIGDESLSYDLLLACMNVKQAREHHLALTEGPKAERPIAEDSQTSTGLQIVESSVTVRSPNLLEERPNFTNVLSLGPVVRPQDRFLLLGGLDGFCTEMKRNKVAPDVKTFSFMLELVENNEAAETELLKKMDDSGVIPDTIFLNQLIRQRAFRKDPAAGRKTLEIFNKHGLKADIITFGCLALCCESRQESMELITNMESQGLRVNFEIMSTLIKKAARRNSPLVVLKLLKLMDQREILPDTALLEALETFHQRFRKHVLNAERGNGENIPKIVRHEMSNDFKGWQEFCTFYAAWLKKSAVDVPKHPWRQFLTPRDEERMTPTMKATFQ